MGGGLPGHTNNRSYPLSLPGMSRYYPLRISKVQPETPECVSVWLEVPEDLRQKFAFKPGQYLNCRGFFDGEEVRKSYSISSLPSDKELVIGVKMVYGGKFSTYVNKELKAGDVFEVTPAEGKFTLPEKLPEDAVLLFFAAGSGITPVISILKFFLGNYPNGQAILFYTNKSSDTIIFREQLEGLKNLYMTRFSVYHILTREVTSIDILSGRIDAEKCREFAKHFFNIKEVTAAYICGPELMIHDLRDGLQEMGLHKDQIKFELFGSGPYKRIAREDVERIAEGEIPCRK